MTAVFGILAAAGAGFAQTPDTPIAGPHPADPQPVPSRVVVKVRESLGSEILASLPPDTLTLAASSPGSAHAKEFIARHAVSGMRPVFPQFAKARLVDGLSEAQVTERIRRKFAARFRRAARILPPAGLDRIYVLTIGGGREELSGVLAQLRADPEIEYAEVDQRYSVVALPNDPYLGSSGTWGQSYADLWGLHNIGAPAAWGISTGSGVTVGVIDTGIDLNHPDIIGNLWTNSGETPASTTDLDGDGYPGDYYGWNFYDSNRNPTDGNGHGTHVAGIIAATANNGIGIAGVAHGARVMAIKGLNDQGYGFDSTLAPAVVYAANRGADVLNLSWGQYGTSQVISDAIDYAYSLGVVIVAAAGNDHLDAARFTPAGLPKAIAVAAIDPTGGLAYFSNIGSKIDVAAPGEDILSLQASGSTLGTIVSSGYMCLSGTSMAAPHVTGLAALVLSAHPEYTNEQVRQVLRVSASSAGSPNSETGYGVIRSAQALAVQAPLEARIMSPLTGISSSGTITFNGVARGSGFASYRLDYGAGAAPAQWTTFASSNTSVSGGVLGTLDVGQLSNGTWTIRLSAQSTSGAVFVDRIQITAVLAAIAVPKPASVLTSATTFKPGKLIQVTGTAIGTGFLNYTLEWAPGAAPGNGWQTTGFTLTGGGAVTVSSGVLGTWDTSALRTAGYYTLRLTVHRANVTDTAMAIVYSQPDLLSTAWPLWLNPGSLDGAIQVCGWSSGCQLVQSSASIGSSYGGLWVISMDGTAHQYQLPSPGFGTVQQPSVAPLSGDSEQVVMMDDERLRVYSAGGQNIQLVPDRAVDIRRGLIPVADLSGAGAWTTLAFGTDWDDKLGYVYAWTGTGATAGSKFPIVVKDQNPINTWGRRLRVIAADVDGDGAKEIIVSEGVSTTTFTLRLYSSDGTPRTWAVPELSGMPERLAAADLDGNGKYEVVVVSYDTDFFNNNSGYATIHVFQPDGSQRSGWPRKFAINSESFEPSLAIGDLAQNGHKQIVWASTMLVVLNADGTLYSSAWPLVQPAGPQIPQGRYGPVVLGDVDGDGKPEIVTTTNNTFTNGNSFFQSSWYYDKRLLAIRLDGTIARSWQLTGDGYNSYTNAIPSIGNFSGDGTTEIAVTYYSYDSGAAVPGVVSVIETGSPYRAALNPWPYVYCTRGNNPVLESGYSGSPRLSITKTHSGNFLQGQRGTYTVTVSNALGAGATSGTVTVTETLPAGLTMASMAGSGWTCADGGNSCTRGDALAGGDSFPGITVTVNVGANAPAQVTNQVTVSGGGSTAAVARDPTTVNTSMFEFANTDFNGDARPDVIWQDPVSGWAQVWYLGGSQGVSTIGAANLTTRNTWRIVDIGDFDRDGRPDVVWQDPVTGAAQVWFLGGSGGNEITAAAVLSGGNSWRIMAIADFNGDGTPDCIWQDQESGWAQIWFMGGAQGTTVTGAVNLTTRNTWRIAGTGDFNMDGVPDVVWQDPATGAVQIWYLGGAQSNVVRNAVNLVNSSALKIAAIADFNFDGHPDVVWQDPNTGAAQVWFLGGAQGITVNSSAAMSAGNTWRIMGPK